MSSRHRRATETFMVEGEDTSFRARGVGVSTSLFLWPLCLPFIGTRGLEISEGYLPGQGHGQVKMKSVSESAEPMAGLPESFPRNTRGKLWAAAG